MKFPIKLGELPNAKFSLGGTSNSNGTTTAPVNLSGSGTFNNTIFTGGLYFSLTGHAGNPPRIFLYTAVAMIWQSRWENEPHS